MPGRTRQVLAIASLLTALAAGCGGSSSASNGPRTQVGDLALDYITKKNYPALKVEIDYIQGFGPSLDAMNRCRAIWEQRIDKPGGIDFVITTEIPFSAARTQWQMGDIMALESQYRKNWTGDAQNKNTAVIWVVYLNGASEFDTATTRALGVSYGGAETAIFRENIERTTLLENTSTRDVVEAMVLVHEGGHLFGLVNGGINMVNGHEDPHSSRHDANQDCVMFHQIETADTARLLTNPPIDYDLQCRLDLFTAGDTIDPPATEPEPGPAPLPGPRAGDRGPIPDMATIPPSRR